jgi:hypothetical protein
MRPWHRFRHCGDFVPMTMPKLKTVRGRIGGGARSAVPLKISRFRKSGPDVATVLRSISFLYAVNLGAFIPSRMRASHKNS